MYNSIQRKRLLRNLKIVDTDDELNASDLMIGGPEVRAVIGMGQMLTMILEALRATDRGALDMKGTDGSQISIENMETTMAGVMKVVIYPPFPNT